MWTSPGRKGRSSPIAVHELEFVKTLTTRPVKIALPGPYLLTRTMWMECISDRAYATREDLARDIVRVLREELAFLLAAGAALVQFDEPVLTEVVFTGAKTQRSFMCGALSEKGDPATELAFARDLINAVVDGFPMDRTAIQSVDEIMAKVERAVSIFGPRRVLLNPDCGFATFADNPVNSSGVAEAKLANMARAAARLRERWREVSD